MIYCYRCPKCGPFEVEKHHSRSDRPEPCPKCRFEVENQDYQAKNAGGFVSTDNSWAEGRHIYQLSPHHPDYTVGSRKEMEKAYKRNGISMDTGKFRTVTDQVRGTLPKRLRTGRTAQVHGAVDDHP